MKAQLIKQVKADDRVYEPGTIGEISLHLVKVKGKKNLKIDKKIEFMADIRTTYEEPILVSPENIEVIGEYDLVVKKPFTQHGDEYFFNDIQTVIDLKDKLEFIPGDYLVECRKNNNTIMSFYTNKQNAEKIEDQPGVLFLEYWDKEN